MIPHPIPYQGSKRHIAKYILPLFPHDLKTLIEPFAGSSAVSIAAACYAKAPLFHLNDINGPLMDLWREIIEAPYGIAASYERLWTAQQGREREYYDHVRDDFNRTKKPEYLLYLLARCVKASVRYNPYGEFNQSPDNRRLGRHPKRMAADIVSVSNLFRGRTTITSKDYAQILQSATTRDLVYMDPPYQGVCDSGDPRYLRGIEFEEFMLALGELDQRKVSYILSYDGRTGTKSFGKELPRELGLCRIEVKAGRSSQSTLLGRQDVTYESIYVSSALAERLSTHPDILADKLVTQGVLQLEFENI